MRYLQKPIITVLRLACLWALASASGVSAATVPEPFRGHDPGSALKISYGDLDMILKTMVVNVGRSTREVHAPPTTVTGTRLKNQWNRRTAYEGNRFFFEEFVNNEEYAEALEAVKIELANVPGVLPLEHFTRTEQLAYWLNLYNLTLIGEIVQFYPKRNLRDALTGDDSLLDWKLLEVAGVPLSLNDIQHTILAVNYDNDPVVMYGLFQGVIGGPSISKRAYTGENVRAYLHANAVEFINSNRGTYVSDGTFRVSSLYARNKACFPNFRADLRRHLLRYIEGPETMALLAVETIEPDIDDWNVADVYGTLRDFGGSFADSKVALLDAVVSTQPDGQGGTTPTNFSVAFSGVISEAPPPSRFGTEVGAFLDSLRTREAATNLMRQGRVTVEELGTVADPAANDNPENDDEN